jgi:hypothetical protein
MQNARANERVILRRTLMTAAPIVRTSLCLVLLVAASGCSGRPQVEASAKVLVGRWSMVPKGLEDEADETGKMRPVPGQSIAFQMVFNAEGTYEQSVDSRFDPAPVLNQKGSIKGKWRVAEARGNTLIVELPEPDLVARVKVEFQSKDRCIYNVGEEEAFVLTRLH